MMRYPPAMQETRVQSLGREDPLEKEMATPSSILAWRNPWTEEPGGLHSMGSWRVGHDWVTDTQYKVIVPRWSNQTGGQTLVSHKKILYSKILNLGEWHIIVSSICHSTLVTKMIKRDVHLYLCLKQQNSSWARVDFHVALDWDELNVGSPSC